VNTVGDIEIVVQNPGQLNVDEQDSIPKLGLHNLKKRLELQYKERGRFMIKEEPAGIITARISIPKL